MPSPKLKTLIIDPLVQTVLDKLSLHLDITYCATASENEILKLLPNAELLILRSGHIMTDLWLNEAKNLKGIIRAGSGIDNIPLTELTQRNINFTHLPGINTNAVVEFALSAILLMLRNLYPAIIDLQSGKWEKAKYCGEELTDQKIGLFGYGNIGKALAKKLSQLNVTTYFYSRSQKTSDFETGTIAVDMAQLCKQSSIITLQIPLNRETKHIINDQFFSMIEKPIYLLNLSRYDVINMQALKRAVDNKKIKAAFIDPVEKNTDVKNFENMPIYFTPHLAGSTFQAQGKIGDAILNKLSEWRFIK